MSHDSALKSASNRASSASEARVQGHRGWIAITSRHPPGDAAKDSSRGGASFSPAVEAYSVRAPKLRTKPTPHKSKTAINRLSLFFGEAIGAAWERVLTRGFWQKSLAHTAVCSGVGSHSNLPVSADPSRYNQSLCYDRS